MLAYVAVEVTCTGVEKTTSPFGNRTDEADPKTTTTGWNMSDNCLMAWYKQHKLTDENDWDMLNTLVVVVGTYEV